MMELDKLKAGLHRGLPKQALTTFAGLLANCQVPLIKNYLIRDFIKRYQVNMAEALNESPEAYPTFNDFFIRHLKPGARVIETADLISPVDGFVSEIGRIEQGQLLQAKGRTYTVSSLLGSDALGEAFHAGAFATLYLSPKDYHRVHMPVSATLKETQHVPGSLFSVQPLTTRHIPALFSRNERLVALFDTPFGLMAMVLVGAVIVGAIGTAWDGDLKRSKLSLKKEYPNTPLHQGDEMGYFKLGSTVILLMADGNRVTWEKSLLPGEPIRFGQALGSVD